MEMNPIQAVMVAALIVVASALWFTAYRRQPNPVAKAQMRQQGIMIILTVVAVLALVLFFFR